MRFFSIGDEISNVVAARAKCDLRSLERQVIESRYSLKRFLTAD